MDNRQEYNEQILKRLERFFRDNPDIRFIQGLHATGILIKGDGSGFYEESSFTLDSMEE